ncbi:MAG: GNAT family N-acetyltransferase [Methanomassiliicoccaceae archaeon]|nr:GNAT family N-acetyltransferase [Methanomassiliicoccaceae archaeon]
MSLRELEQCSELFSENYGKYSEYAGEEKAGHKVRMSVPYYERHYMADDHYVALAKVNSKVIAHAFYVRKTIDGRSITWVLQLVVHESYRGKGIGSRLLHSIWGFSNDCAWGLATANPLTVKTLESATFREVLPSEISKHIKDIKWLGSKIHFVKDYLVDEERSMVNTEFFVDLQGIEKLTRSVFNGNWKLGNLLPGYEWLAFTFDDQPVHEGYEKNFMNIIQFSEQRLRDAYGRMKVRDQPWAHHTGEEVAHIFKTMERLGTDVRNVIDFGCGEGRHSVEIASKYSEIKVRGVDFSAASIRTAKARAKKLSNVSFSVADCRKIRRHSKYDLALCLYDVVGSFPDEKDNMRIVSNLYDHLVPGGYMFMSVMNMELTEHLAHPNNIGPISRDPKILFDLEAGDIMQRTGNVFDPDHYAIDTVTGLVFRKEQFHGDGKLSVEYVIRDKRYRRAELEGLIADRGFEIITCEYVQAGRWDEPLTPTDIKAKEILVVARKPPAHP